MGVQFLHLLSSCDEYEVHEVPAGPPATPGELCVTQTDPTSRAPSAHHHIAALLAAVMLPALGATWI